MRSEKDHERGPAHAGRPVRRRRARRRRAGPLRSPPGRLRRLRGTRWRSSAPRPAGSAASWPRTPRRPCARRSWTASATTRQVSPVEPVDELDGPPIAVAGPLAGPRAGRGGGRRRPPPRRRPGSAPTGPWTVSRPSSAVLTAPDATSVALEGTSPARMRLVYSPSLDRSVSWSPTGWPTCRPTAPTRSGSSATERPRGGQPVPHRRAAEPRRLLDRTPEGYQALGVTKEPAGGSPQPTEPILLPGADRPDG